MIEQLKACDFCGSTEVSLSFSATMESPDPAHRFVECEKCAACGPAVPVDGDDQLASTKAITAWNTRPTPPTEPAGDVEKVAKPWAHFDGDLPDWGHPLRCVYESGIQYAVNLLAKVLKVDDYEVCDGTEEFDGDLGGTMFNIVLAAMPNDEHGDPMHPSEVRAAIAAMQPRSGEVRYKPNVGDRSETRRADGKCGMCGGKGAIPVTTYAGAPNAGYALCPQGCPVEPGETEGDVMPWRETVFHDSTLSGHAVYTYEWGKHSTFPGAKPGASPATERGAHSDDLAVDRFAIAMKAKLAQKRAEGRGGWDRPDECSAELLSSMLHDHAAKGDPVDVGNFAMMLHQRGERIVPAEPANGADLIKDALRRATINAGEWMKHARALEAEAAFLLCRISELDWSLSPEDFAREFSGHVEPSIERLRILCSAAP